MTNSYDSCLHLFPVCCDLHLHVTFVAIIGLGASGGGHVEDAGVVHQQVDAVVILTAA
jgi:hypothetical protein